MKTIDVDRHVQSLTWTARLINYLLHALIWLAFWVRRLDFKVADKKAIPKKGPAIIVGADHTSLADALFTIAAMRRPYAGIGMAELRTGDDWPWFIGKGFDLLGHIPIDRGSRESGDAAFAEGLRVLGLGQTLFVWPQGRQVPQGDTSARWYDGFARFAMETGSPIYVFKVEGADDFWHTNPDQGGPGKMNWRAKVRARFSDPIDPADYETVEQIVEATKRVHAELPLVS